MKKTLNISNSEALGAVLALGLAAAAAHAFGLSHDDRHRGALGDGAGGIWVDQPDIAGPGVAHTDQGPAKSGVVSFASIQSPPSTGGGTLSPWLSDNLGSDLGLGTDFLSSDAVNGGTIGHFPTVGPLTLYDFEEFTALKNAQGTPPEAPATLGTSAIPSPGSILLVGVAGSIAGLRRKRVR